MPVARATWQKLAGLGIGWYATAVLLLAATMPVRFTPPGLGRSISVFDVAIAVLIVPMEVLVRRQGWPRIPRPYLVLAVLMLGLGALSLAWSVDRGDTLVHVVVSIESLLAFACAMVFLRDVDERGWHRWLQFFTVLLVVPGLLLWLGVPGFQPPAEVDPRSGDYWSYFVRLSHPYIGRSNNLAALLMLMVVPLGRWAMRTRKAWDIAAALIAAVALILTFGRGAMVALVLALGLFMVVDRSLRRQILKALRWAIPVLVIAVVIGALNPLTRQLIAVRLSLANIEARLTLLAGFWSDLGRHWLLGSGAGTGVDVHNTYAQQLLSFGIPGGLAVIVALGWTGVWWFRGSAETRPVVSRVFGIGVVALLLSFAVESSFEGNLLRPLIWLVWGLLVTLAVWPSRRVIPPGDTSSWTSWPVRRGAPADSGSETAPSA